MSEQPVKTGKKLNATQIILIIGIVIVVIAVAVVGWLLLKDKKQEQAGPGEGNIVIDDTNMEDVIAELDRKAAEGMFEVKMNGLWTFPKGTLEPSSDAYVANSTANHGPFYFVVTMEDGTEIYKSPTIPLGSAVEKFALTTKLEPGNYECVCTYNILNEDETPKTTASVVVRLQVDE